MVATAAGAPQPLAVDRDSDQLSGDVAGGGRDPGGEVGIGDPRSDRGVERVAIDRLQVGADRVLRGGDVAAPCPMEPATQPGEDLLGEISGGLTDPPVGLRSRHRRHDRHRDDRGDRVADPPSGAVIGDPVESGQKPPVRLEVQQVAVDDRDPPGVTGEHRVIEHGGQHRSAVTAQFTGPHRLGPAVMDVAAVGAAPPGGLTDHGKVRGPVAATGVTGRVGERLRQHHRMAPHRFPIGRQAPQRRPQHR